MFRSLDSGIHNLGSGVAPRSLKINTKERDARENEEMPSGLGGGLTSAHALGSAMVLVAPQVDDITTSRRGDSSPEQIRLVDTF